MKRRIDVLLLFALLFAFCSCKGTRSITTNHAEQHTAEAETASVAVATTTATETVSQTNTIKIEFDTDDTSATSNSSWLLEWLFVHDTNVGCKGQMSTPTGNLPRIKSIEASQAITATKEQTGTTIEANQATTTESHTAKADSTATSTTAKEKSNNTVLWLALMLGTLLFAIGIYIGAKADRHT
ncbi:MAG: hypothetical protein IJ745_02575 [Bacteroidales bacterium]|nr:hypothetical protein [Bacteroidales bacterium]